MTNTVYIGWDSREHEAYAVAKHSIERRSPGAGCVPLVLNELKGYLTRPIDRRDGKLWCPISNAPMATEFAISRFCVPFLFKNHGWALFVDCDIVCLADVRELFSLADNRYAVMVCKHGEQIREQVQTSHNAQVREMWCGAATKPSILQVVLQRMEENLESRSSNFSSKTEERDLQIIRELLSQEREDQDITMREVWGEEFADAPSELRQAVEDHLALSHVSLGSTSLKMDGQVQTYYARKNWSSVVLWNCDHPAHERFTLEHLNTWPGRDLHAFKWLHDEEIGELPPNWNYLVDVNPRPDPIKVAHFTLGGPWFHDWKGGSCDDIWLAERKDMLNECDAA